MKKLILPLQVISLCFIFTFSFNPVSYAAKPASCTVALSELLGASLGIADIVVMAHNNVVMTTMGGGVLFTSGEGAELNHYPMGQWLRKPSAAFAGAGRVFKLVEGSYLLTHVNTVDVIGAYSTPAVKDREPTGMLLIQSTAPGKIRKIHLTPNKSVLKAIPALRSISRVRVIGLTSPTPISFSSKLLLHLQINAMNRTKGSDRSEPTNFYGWGSFDLRSGKMVKFDLDPEKF